MEMKSPVNTVGMKSPNFGVMLDKINDIGV